MDPVIGAALISAGANIVGGLFGSNSAKSQNKAAAQQADKEMDFQERMSSTAHQREVADLKAAGLNPILSAHGGASSPGGAMAPVVNETEPLRDSLKNSAASVAQVILTQELAKTEKTKQLLNNATTAKTIESTGKESLINEIQSGLRTATAWSGKAAEYITRPANLRPDLRVASKQNRYRG